MSAKRVLSVGQCAADHYRIDQAIRARFSATVTPAATTDEAVEMLQREKYDLVLINRILDADGASGLTAITQIRNSVSEPPPLMLVSNYAEYHQQAEQLGGVPGIGKGSIDKAETVARLGKYLW